MDELVLFSGDVITYPCPYDAWLLLVICQKDSSCIHKLEKKDREISLFNWYLKAVGVSECVFPTHHMYKDTYFIQNLHTGLQLI